MQAVLCSVESHRAKAEFFGGVEVYPERHVGIVVDKRRRLAQRKLQGIKCGQLPLCWGFKFCFGSLSSTLLTPFRCLLEETSFQGLEEGG